MKKIILTLLFALLLVTSFPQNDITLVKNGKSDYVIALCWENTEFTILAAHTLQDYIKRISGCEIPIVTDGHLPRKEERMLKNKKFICIGPVKYGRVIFGSEHGTLGYRDTIAIVAKKGNLLMNCSTSDLAHEDIYNLYAVEEFLEKYLGVKVFAPDCEYVPRSPNIILHDFHDFLFVPQNHFRVVRSQYTKENAHFRHWMKQNLISEMFHDGYFVHTMNKFVPPAQLFDAHPDYFALLNGERVRDQVCFSHPDVYRMVSDSIRQMMKGTKWHEIISVSQNDNDIYCHCPQCTAMMEAHGGSPAAPIINFVNRLSKEFPGHISTLAYRFSRQAPANMKLDSTLQIMLCTIEENRNKTVEQNNAFTKDMEEWARLTDNIFLWDYEVDFAYSLAPFPNLHVLQPNIQYFIRHNARQHFQQSNSYVGGELSELKTYLIAQLLWNPDADSESIIHDFCTHYYGAAGTYIESYIRDIEQVAVSMQDSIVLDIYGAPVRYKDNILCTDNLQRYDGYFDRAEEAVKDDSVLLSRVRRTRLSIDYAFMELGKCDLFGARGWYVKNNDGQWTLRPEMQQRLERFEQTCRLQKNGKVGMNESGLYSDIYLAGLRRFLDIDITGDLAFQKRVTSDTPPESGYCNGKLAVLTDGAKGGDDYKMNWLGWWGKDFTLTLDLDSVLTPREITLSSLAFPKSWILHPLAVSCEVSCDGQTWQPLGTLLGDGLNQENTEAIKEYTFKTKGGSFRYVRFHIEATKVLPAWHPSYGNASWVFLDEITVR